MDSHVNLNKVGALYLLISAYLSCNRQGQIKINEAGLRSMKRKCHQHVLSIFQIIIPQIS